MTKQQLLNQIADKVKPYYADGQKEVDITAVLKFIDNQDDFVKGFDEDSFYFDGCEGYVNTPYEEGCLNEIEIDIPNKPLTLYSTQQLQELINLLNNI